MGGGEGDKQTVCREILMADLTELGNRVTEGVSKDKEGVGVGKCDPKSTCLC